MMKALLKASDLTREEFEALIGQLPRTDDERRIWLEAPDGWAFSWWQGLEEPLLWRGAGREPIQESSRESLTRSTAGRLFAPEGELRWRVIPDLEPKSWRTLFLGSADWVGAGLADHSDCLNPLVPQRIPLLLWGRRTESAPEEWIELRIPHRFRYPIKDANAQNVHVLTEQWCDASGEPHFVRWCDLEPFSETT